MKRDFAFVGAQMHNRIHRSGLSPKMHEVSAEDLEKLYNDVAVLGRGCLFTHKDSPPEYVSFAEMMLTRKFNGTVQNPAIIKMRKRTGATSFKALLRYGNLNEDVLEVD